MILKSFFLHVLRKITIDDIKWPPIQIVSARVSNIINNIIGIIWQYYNLLIPFLIAEQI